MDMTVEGNVRTNTTTSEIRTVTPEVNQRRRTYRFTNQHQHINLFLEYDDISQLDELLGKFAIQDLSHVIESILSALASSACNQQANHTMTNDLQDLRACLLCDYGPLCGQSFNKKTPVSQRDGCGSEEKAVTGSSVE